MRSCFQILENIPPIREKRRYYEEHPEIVEQILRDGSEQARVKAKEVLKEVRNLVKMF